MYVRVRVCVCMCVYVYVCMYIFIYVCVWKTLPRSLGARRSCQVTAICVTKVYMSTTGADVFLLKIEC